MGEKETSEAELGPYRGMVLLSLRTQTADCLGHPGAREKETSEAELGPYRGMVLLSLRTQTADCLIP